MRSVVLLMALSLLVAVQAGQGAYDFMTRMIEGKKWVRNDSLGLEVYAVVFADEAKGEDTMALWSPNPFAYVRINNTERGLTFYDVYGTKRFVPYNKMRTSHLPVPLGESPIYVVGHALFAVA